MGEEEIWDGVCHLSANGWGGYTADRDGIHPIRDDGQASNT